MWASLTQILSVVWNLEGYTGFFLTQIIVFPETSLLQKDQMSYIALNVVVFSVHTGAIHDSGGSTAKGGSGARSSLI